MTALTTILALVCIAATIVPLFKHEAWWVRSCDFPRVQIVVVSLITLMIFLMTPAQMTGFTIFAALSLIAAVAYQLFIIAPYTPLWPVEVLQSNKVREDRRIRLLMCNVLMTNRHSERLGEIIKESDADVVLAVEVDDWWGEKLRSLAHIYPYRLEHPLPNTYGIALYSKLQLIDCELRFLVRDEVPSIRTDILLKSGERIKFCGLHPEPPSPSEADTSLPRDAELVMVAREIAKDGGSTIVAGDLNDVAWSHTSRLFRRISRLLDPRVGRGMFNSFHASIWPLRWPLDHIFLSTDFTLESIRRLPAFGSDHFPIFIALAYRPAATELQEPQRADHDDHAEAKDKLFRAANDPTIAGVP